MRSATRSWPRTRNRQCQQCGALSTDMRAPLPTRRSQRSHVPSERARTNGDVEEEDASTITISDCGQNGKPKRALKGLARRISRARRVWHCAAGESASGIGRRHDKVTDTD